MYNIYVMRNIFLNLVQSTPKHYATSNNKYASYFIMINNNNTFNNKLRIVSKNNDSMRPVEIFVINIKISKDNNMIADHK